MKRLAILAVLAAIGLFGLASPVAAAPQSSSCLVYVTSPLTVTGNQAMVTVSTKGCTTKVGLAVYEAPSAKFDPVNADQQKLAGACGVPECVLNARRGRCRTGP
jgi:hypothetical protein